MTSRFDPHSGLSAMTYSAGPENAPVTALSTNRPPHNLCPHESSAISAFRNVKCGHQDTAKRFYTFNGVFAWPSPSIDQSTRKASCKAKRSTSRPIVCLKTIQVPQQADMCCLGGTPSQRWHCLQVDRWMLPAMCSSGLYGNSSH